MAKGKTFKQCGCRDAANGQRLGQRCPKLRRARGAWSWNHGTWSYQLELPPHANGSRRGPLRRSGFATQDEAAAEMNTARELLTIARDDDATATAIADVIVQTIKDTRRLPDADVLRRKVRTGQDLSTQLTVGQWLEQWLRGKQRLRPGTTASYAAHIRLYLTPTIGHHRIDKLQTAHVAAVFEAIDELNETILAARASGDPVLRAKVKGRRLVSAATKQRIRATLRAALNAAMRQRLIDVNPAALIELPAGKRPKALVWTPERITAWRASRETYIAATYERKKALAAASRHGAKLGTRVTAYNSYVATPRPSPVMVWTPEQTAAFLRRAKGHRLYALYHVIAFRGLRRGEGCGLRWPDLDLAAGQMSIGWQIVRIGGTIAQGQPKSEAGQRHVALDKQTVRELLAHRSRQNAERLAAGSDWADTGFVFANETGQPLDPAEVTEQFHWLCMETDLPPIRLHDLRHGAATLLLAAGHDMKTVQETLGLSSITIAADTYTSVLPDLARKAAEDVAALLTPTERRSGGPRRTLRLVTEAGE
jgi:integrase